VATHYYLAPSLRMSGAIPQLTLYCFLVCTGKTLRLLYLSVFVFIIVIITTFIIVIIFFVLFFLFLLYQE